MPFLTMSNKTASSFEVLNSDRNIQNFFTINHSQNKVKNIKSFFNLEYNKNKLKINKGKKINKNAFSDLYDYNTILFKKN